jgi:hypothetical protein
VQLFAISIGLSSIAVVVWLIGNIPEIPWYFQVFMKSSSLAVDSICVRSYDS